MGGFVGFDKVFSGPGGFYGGVHGRFFSNA